MTGLLAAQVFRELAAWLPYPVALQLVTDEEVGGRDGTRHQLDHGVRGRFVIVGETSGLHIVNESKGMLVAPTSPRCCRITTPCASSSPVRSAK